MHKLSCFINDKHTGKTVSCFFCVCFFLQIPRAMSVHTLIITSSCGRKRWIVSAKTVYPQRHYAFQKVHLWRR